MGLDRGGPTHKQKKYVYFFPLSHPYTAATAARIFVDNIFIAWNATLNCQRQGTRSSLAISGRSSFLSFTRDTILHEYCFPPPD